MRLSWPAFLVLACTLAWWGLGSAMAKIEQFKDEEGKLHITNVEPEAQTKPGGPSPAFPGAKLKQPPPAAQAPPQAEPAEPPPAESSTETPPEAPQAEVPAPPEQPPGEQPQTGAGQQGSSWMERARLPGYPV